MSEYRDAAGTLWITQGGQWRPATEGETTARETSGLDAAGQFIPQDFQDFASLGGVVGELLARRRPSQVLQRTESAMQDIARRGQANELLTQAHPEARAAATGFSLLADPLNLLGVGPARKAGQGVAVRAARAQGADTMASRVARQVDEAGPAAGRGADDSVGASAVAWDEVDPGLFPTIGRWLADEFTDPQVLTKAQRELVAVGDNFGFSWLPGQQEGQNLLIGGVKSHPILKGAFDSVLSANRLGFDQAWLRAIGSDATEFTREALGRRMDEIGDGMDGLAVRIGDTKIPAETANQIAQIRKLEPDLDQLLVELGEVGAAVPLTGQQIMGVRSLLNKTSSQLWRGANSNPMRAERIDGVINKLDDVIKDGMGPDGMREWQTLRQQWRNAKLLEDPGVISKNEMLNPASVHAKLTGRGKSGSKVYARNTTDFSGVKNEATQRAYEWTRVSNAFGDNLGDSGTASRVFLQNALRGDVKGMVQTLVLKRVLERQAVKRLSPEGSRALDDLDAGLAGETL